MRDSETPLQSLKDMAVKFRDDRGWAQFHTPKDLAAALSIEAGELLEIFLWKDRREMSQQTKALDIRARIAEETADILIYLMYLAHDSDIDLAQAVEHKLEINARKYPVRQSCGSNRKYTELGE